MARKQQTDANKNESNEETAAVPDPAPDQPESVQVPEAEIVLGAPDEAAADADTMPEPESKDLGEDVPQPAAPKPAHVEPNRRGGFWPLALGGAVAAGLGFAGASMLFAPKASFSAAEEMAALTADVRGLTERIATLRSEMETLRADPRIADLAALQADTPAQINQAFADAAQPISNRIDGAVTAIDDLNSRLVALEKRPIASGAASASALEAISREMADLRAEIEADRVATADAQARIATAAEAAVSRISAAEAEAEKLKSEAEVTAQNTTARAALSRVYAAFDGGTSLEGGLNDLAASGIEVPTGLAELAIGVPSLTSLRNAYPAAARNALAASLNASAGETTWGRIGAFLRSQSGARSLTPRAGNDPDAILSRAEAALNAGDLAGALSELQALPETGRVAMAEWTDLANRRIAAKEAIAALAEQVN